MTPDQTAAAEVITREVADGYGDQLVPGAAEHLGHIWAAGGMGNMPADRRAEEIAKRVASPLVDRFRDPGYDPATAPTPVERALRQQSHRLADGAVEGLAGRWSVDLAGRDPARVAGEVARRLDQLGEQDHRKFLKAPYQAPAYEDRVYALLSANFDDLMSVDGKMALARDRGKEFSRMSDQQIILMVAGSLRASVVAAKYSGGATIAAGDPRLQGRGEYTTPAREAQATRTNFSANRTPAASQASRDPAERFVPGDATTPRRRMSF